MFISTKCFVFFQIGYKSNLRNSKSISDLSNIPEKDTSYVSGNQGNQTVCDDNFFYLPAPVASPATHSVTSSIQQLFHSSGARTVHNAIEDVPELLYGCLPRHASSSIPELGSSCFSEYGGSGCDNGVENLRKISAAMFDSSAVPKDQQRTGKQLLAQLERDLLEFDLLMGCSSSPPEVDTDSLEETLRSLSLLSSHEPLFRKIHQMHHRPTDDSDSDTVKSETSNFSCDSLEDREFEDEEEATPVKECKSVPQQPINEASSRTLPFPRRKRQRWQRLSLEGVTKVKPNDYESDVFPTNEGPSNSSSQVFRTSSDTALANSDSSHSDVQTPTNPPFFSVKSPGPIVSTAPSVASSDHTSQAGKQHKNSDSDISLVTIETHSYRLEHSDPLSVPLPQSPKVEQLKRESRETSPQRQPNTKGQAPLPPASIVDAEDFPVVQAQPLPPGPPPAVYLPSSQSSLPLGAIPAPGRAHRVLLAKKVTIQQVLPSKRKLGYLVMPGYSHGMRNDPAG